MPALGPASGSLGGLQQGSCRQPRLFGLGKSRSGGGPIGQELLHLRAGLGGLLAAEIEDRPVQPLHIGGQTRDRAFRLGERSLRRAPVSRPSDQSPPASA